MFQGELCILMSSTSRRLPADEVSNTMYCLMNGNCHVSLATKWVCEKGGGADNLVCFLSKWSWGGNLTKMCSTNGPSYPLLLGIAKSNKVGVDKVSWTVFVVILNL